MTRKLVFAVMWSLALLVAGCGGDDGGGSDVSDKAQPYVDALTTNLQSNEPDELALDSDQADCVAPQWVDIAGVERLEEADIAPADLESDADTELAALSLDEDEAGQMVDALGDCDIDLRQEILSTLDEDASLTEPQRDCLRDALDDQLLRDILVATLAQGDPQSDPELAERVNSATAPCQDAG